MLAKCMLINSCKMLLPVSVAYMLIHGLALSFEVLLSSLSPSPSPSPRGS